MSALIDEVRESLSLPDPHAAREIREDAGASQWRLADELGVHELTVQRWEAGTRTPKAPSARLRPSVARAGPGDPRRTEGHIMTKTIGAAGADQDAAAAAAAVREAEDELGAGGRGVTAVALHKLRDGFRHAELAARGAHQRADRERQAARVAGLDEIGRQVDALAAGAGTELAEALQEVADACRKVRSLAAAHDAAMADLIAAAWDLRAESRAPAGPRKTSGYVAVAVNAISYKRTTVHRVGGKLAAVLALAIDGQPEAAANKAELVTEQPPPHRATHYLRRVADGVIFTYDGKDLPGGWVGQLSRGELERLTDRGIELYLQGEL